MMQLTCSTSCAACVCIHFTWRWTCGVAPSRTTCLPRIQWATAAAGKHFPILQIKFDRMPADCRRALQFSAYLCTFSPTAMNVLYLACRAVRDMFCSAYPAQLNNVESFNNVSCSHSSSTASAVQAAQRWVSLSAASAAGYDTIRSHFCGHVVM